MFRVGCSLFVVRGLLVFVCCLIDDVCRLFVMFVCFCSFLS